VSYFPLLAKSEITVASYLCCICASCVTVSAWTIDTCLVCYCQCVDNWHMPHVLLSVCGQL